MQRNQIPGRLVAVLCGLALLSACVGLRPGNRPLAPVPWATRVADLQHLASWQLDGRAAAAVGSQGWQASLNWRQRGDASELHLAGPLGVGATVLKKTPEGISLNGAPPSDAVLAQVQDRLGFELPLADLRYWLLGVPAPGSPFQLTENANDRAQQLQQSGWTVDYDGYAAVNGDLLPTRVVLSREGVRVRIAVDHWMAPA
jgi:outer membrane lipoprotein LolB